MRGRSEGRITHEAIKTHRNRGRGSEGRISHEAIKADRPLPTVVNRESEIHVKFGLLTSSQILPAFKSKKPVGLKIFDLNYRTPLGSQTLKVTSGLHESQSKVSQITSKN